MSANMKVFPDKEKYHDVLRNDFVNGKLQRGSAKFSNLLL